MAQISAKTIKNDFDTHGMTSLMAGAARGIYTLPDGIADAYAQLLELLDQNSDRFGNVQGWQAEKEATRLTAQMWSSAYGGSADSLLKDHLRPGLHRYLDQFRTNMAKAGQYASHTDAGALLSQPEDIRQAWLDLTQSHADYHALRLAWEMCRKRAGGGINGATCNDPLDLRSPLAEVRNISDLFPEWKQATTGHKPWPWHGTAHHVRLIWLLSHDGELWMPTSQEQNAAWLQDNPGRRFAA